MHFRSVTDLSQCIVRNMHRLPPDIDLVVGVPRSGILAGSIVALAINSKLADIDAFVEDRIYKTGQTRGVRGESDRPIKTVLVVDDSANEGTAMREARRKLEPLAERFAIYYCVVYGTAATMPGIDVVLEPVPQPRLFEWNFMHSTMLQHCCVDIDGVLCLDPTEDENDDGHRYLEFLASARPHYTPTHRIGWLVTSRLEKYRAQTEQWLASRGIQYDQLVMLDLASKEERIRTNAHSRHKAEFYRSSAALLFIESEDQQAHTICESSSKPVLSLESVTLFTPSSISLEQRLKSLTSPRTLLVSKSGIRLKRGLRLILGEAGYTLLKRLATSAGR